MMKAIPICIVSALMLASCSSAGGISESSSAAAAAVTTSSTAATAASQTTTTTAPETTVTTTIAAETTSPAVTEPEQQEKPSEVLIDTGVFNHYGCSLAGNTACGATAGTLILQSISYLSGDELAERMETIRNYSALGDEYSCGAPQYYLAGFQISNSLNKYLNDNKLSGYRLTNHRTDKSTEETLMELLSTGRPAVLEVCYGNGAVLPDFQGYSHWICVNGYCVTDAGVEFRYADTIAAAENWVSSELLDKSNANVSYGDFYLQPERYICSFEKPITP